MVAPRKEGFGKDEKVEGSDRSDRPLGGDSSEEHREIDGSFSSGRRISGGLAERLRDVLRDESNGDLLLDRSDVENGILQWLRALDLQVLGACRADERLKPLLKLNISSGVAEDLLIAQLSQHFDMSEIGILARCLCIPLVSIRVGKVNKQGNLLCPTGIRGHLNLSLFPSSNMHISFTGDDGCTERLAVVSNDNESSTIVIEEISADNSGRSFLLKLPGPRIAYFWCSEKSKLFGMELLAKMKDLLRRKPTLSHLTGISDTRLNSFGTHLRAYLLASGNHPESDSSGLSNGSLTTVSSLHASEFDAHSQSKVSTTFRLRLAASNTAKGHPSYQGSLSPRLNTFKDGSPRSSSSSRSGLKEKTKRRGDNIHSSLSFNCQTNTSESASCVQSAGQCEGDDITDCESCSLAPSIAQPELPCLSSLSSSNPLSLNLGLPKVSGSSSLYSPYYCWCPPCPSSLQYTVTSAHLPISYDECLPLPPLSSLLSSGGAPVSLVTSKLPVDSANLPTMSFPSLFPESLVHLPLPGSSLATLSSSQQVPTFTPFMGDPIVHIPVIDVCSSGQGYLVSAGPSLSSAIPPLLPNHSLIPNNESAVEKSARETLRMLMASTPTFTSPKLNILPLVIDRMDENFRRTPESKQCVIATGSQGLYSGTSDVKAAAMGLFSMGLSSRIKVADNDSFRRQMLQRNSHGGDEDPVQGHSVSEGYDRAKEGSA